jgi:hypothetical protein
MKVIIEVKTYLLVDVENTNEADRCGGRLSENVADTTAGFSPYTTHISTGFCVLSPEETTEFLKPYQAPSQPTNNQEAESEARLKEDDCLREGQVFEIPADSEFLEDSRTCRSLMNINAIGVSTEARLDRRHLLTENLEKITHARRN